MTAKTRRERIEDMLAETPDDPELRYALAMEHKSAGDEEAAVRCFRELLAVAPAYVPAYFQTGQLLAQLGREDEARGVLQDGVAAARRTGDEHAAGEMTALLMTLG